jgi:hypothetical protein
MVSAYIMMKMQVGMDDQVIAEIKKLGPYQKLSPNDSAEFTTVSRVLIVD